MESEGTTVRDIRVHQSCSCDGTCSGPVGPSCDEMRSRIVRHCAPTLAGLKCGSMFKVCGIDGKGMERMVSREIAHYHDRGLRYEMLHTDECGTLVYIYRPSMLMDRMSETGVSGFLSGYGYDVTDAGSMVSFLRERFSECGMPPEVGIFLDYPLEDVIGYKENGGRGCRTIGCWKVYGDVDAAERRFDTYRRCRDVLMHMLSRGSGLDDMVVSC